MSVHIAASVTNTKAIGTVQIVVIAADNKVTIVLGAVVQIGNIVVQLLRADNECVHIGISIMGSKQTVNCSRTGLFGLDFKGAEAEATSSIDVTVKC